MNPEEKLRMTDQFRSLSDAFDDTLNLDRDIILFRPPSVPNAWSIIEQVMHCADFDIANFHRYRWGIVAPQTVVLSFDAKWVSVLDYQSSDLTLAIATIKDIRMLMASHLERIINTDWKEYSYRFADGTSFNMEEALHHFINHVGFHRELIDRNIMLYKER